MRDIASKDTTREMYQKMDNLTAWWGDEGRFNRERIAFPGGKVKDSIEKHIYEADR